MTAKLKAGAPAKPDMLRAGVHGRPVQVDRKNGQILGMVVAQEGPFKSPGRGEFDLDGLERIVQLGKKAPSGLRSRFQHPTASDDGLGKFLGRASSFRMSTALADRPEGKVEVAAVRADLSLSKAAYDTPSGNLAEYVLNLAEEDPDALSSSLVLTADREYRVDKKGVPLRGEDGEDLPPLWIPTRLYASDIVDTGDAVDGLLSVDDLPDAIHRRAAEMLDRFFGGHPDEVVRERCLSYLEKYLTHRSTRTESLAPAQSSERMKKLRQQVAEELLYLRSMK
jgi:hypothetical protein